MLEHRYRYPDGRERCYEVRAFPVSDGLAALFRDITSQRELERDAELSFERVQLALDAGAILGTWVWSIPDDRLLGDERFAVSFGFDPAELREGVPLARAFAAIHPDDVATTRQAVDDALEQKGRYRCQYRVLREGAYRWVEASGRIDVDAQGRPVRFPVVLLDVEDRVRVQAERDRATTMLQTFIEAVPGVVYAKDREGRLLVGNRGTAKLLGRPPEAFVGRTDAELLADPAEAEAIMAADRRVMESGVAERIEEPVRRPDGSQAIWWSTKEPLRDANGEVIGLVGSSVDISDRKAIEDALRVSEERRALAIEVAQLGIWQLDLQTGRVIADGRCRVLCGFDAESIDLAHVRERVHPDDWPRVQRSLEQASDPAGTGRYAEDFRWLHADGRIVWTASQGSVQFADSGAGRVAVSMLASVIDITERRQLIEALEQADRRKDEFLAMLAHELRNPLAPINTASHVLRLSGHDPARTRDASDIISRQVSHLTRLVDDLLDVSRVTRGLVELDRQPVDLALVVSTAVEQAKPLLQARRHDLATRIAAGGFTVQGDFHRLVQVVSNLLNNAAKYTPQGGVIEVGLAGDGAQALLTVADSGVGIAPHMLEEVFDLFTQAERTPDRSQGGLGIGLALVKSLVQLHGGRVRAESRGAHRGTTFHVELPLSTATAAAPGRSRPVDVSGVARRVLVVDDNVDAASTLADVLQLSGHSVRVAHDGEGALVAAVADGDTRWDACILDIGLPDMTGYELARQLRSLGPTRAAVFIALTGYGQAHDRVISKSSGFDHHLVKPADIDALMRLLTEAVA
jgi:PAS domain S-box-containing protein